MSDVQAPEFLPPVMRRPENSHLIEQYRRDVAEALADAPVGATCPEWCADHNALHGTFDDVLAEPGVSVRFHELAFGPYVSVVQDERHEAGVFTLEPAYITCDTDGNQCLSGSQAMQFAQHLKDATEKLYEIHSKAGV
jgi:hypothetical protein